MRKWRAWFDHQIETLQPGCFALVMATGIVSNALFLETHRAWSDALFVVNLVTYPWLVLMTILRLFRFRQAMRSDLFNPSVVFAFLTIVAGTDVFGASLYLRGFATAALLLWLLALGAWFILIYFGFAVLTFVNTHRDADIVHGGWLIAIVGTESLVILGALIAPETGDFAPTVSVLIHMLWGIGLVLYGIFIVLFANRILFHDVGPDDITPVLWIVMGAAAISTNAGSTLVLHDSGMPFLDSMRPFVDGVTLIMWVWASWWIPLLLLFGIWKHGIHRVSLVYTAMLWSVVFPLGMYAVASLRLSLAADFSPLRAISSAMAWVALAAWAATSTGLVAACWRSFREFQPSGSGQSPGWAKKSANQGRS